MANPWESIDLDDYENHMRQETVRQLQAMNGIMADQFYRYPASTVMILGVAGGNGLNHIDPNRIARVYGVDINGAYLNRCMERYPGLKNVFIPIRCDLQSGDVKLPPADTVIANLLIEYIGYRSFQSVIQQVRPRVVSCVIQVNTGSGFVSSSPYLRIFDRLCEVHRQTDQSGVVQAMDEIGYSLIYRQNTGLPNEKSLLRLDFSPHGQAGAE